MHVINENKAVLGESMSCVRKKNSLASRMFIQGGTDGLLKNWRNVINFGILSVSECSYFVFYAPKSQ